MRVQIDRLKGQLAAERASHLEAMAGARREAEAATAALRRAEKQKAGEWSAGNRIAGRELREVGERRRNPACARFPYRALLPLRLAAPPRPLLAQSSLWPSRSR